MAEPVAVKKPYSSGGVASAQLRPLKGVKIAEQNATGYFSARTYDPFAAYNSWVERRGVPLPPHLEFANLSQNQESLVAFLEKYGPLPHWKDGFQGQEEQETKQDSSWYLPVRESVAELRKANSYVEFTPVRSSNLIPQRLPVTVNISDFFAEKAEFRFLYAVWEALRKQRSTDEIKTLFLEIVKAPPTVRYGPMVFTPHLLGDLQVIFEVPSPKTSLTDEDLQKFIRTRKVKFHPRTEEPGIPFCRDIQKALEYNIRPLPRAELEQAGHQLLRRCLNSRLGRVHPMLTMGDIGDKDSGGLHQSWRCGTLLEALYTMFFLDITTGRKVMRCGHCGVFFASTKENVRFCSTRCANNFRSWKWWREHRNRWRKKRAGGRKT